MAELSLVVAWLSLGATGFTAGAVGVGMARRRLQRFATPAEVERAEQQLVDAA